MVMFHPEIPYAEAMRRSLRQAGLLERLCRDIESPNDIDWSEVEALVKEMLAP